MIPVNRVALHFLPCRLNDPVHLTTRPFLPRPAGGDGLPGGPLILDFLFVFLPLRFLYPELLLDNLDYKLFQVVLGH